MGSSDEANAADLNGVLDRVTDAIYALDSEWQFTYVNAQAESLLGHAEEELRGEVLWEVFPEAVDSALHDQFQKAMETQESVSFEHYSEPLDIWAEVQIYPSETGLSVYFRDVTERKQSESERKLFRNIIDRSNDAMFVIDPETGRFLDVNDTACHRLGYDRSELLELTVPDIEMQLPDREAWQAHVEDVQTQSALTFEGKHRRADGTSIPVEVNVSHVDLDREYMFAVARDVTERKERERELKRNNEQLEALFEVLPVGVVVAEADGEIIKANDTAHAIWGGDVFDADSIEEYDQYPVRWADSDERVEPAEMTLARVVDGEEVTEPDIFEIDAADGERRIVELEGMPIQDESGKVDRGVVTMSDITERKEAQRQLAESERLYRTLAEHFPNGTVGVYDHDLRYTLAAGEKVGGPAPSAEEIEGTRMPELYPDDAVADLEPLFRAAIEDGETGNIETEVVGRHWRVWATPLRDADGEIFAGLSFAQDITEQKEREAELERALDLLERTERIADVGGWEIDPKTQDVFWTDHIFDLLEVDAPEEPPLDEALDMYHEDDQPIVQAAVENALDSGDPFDIEVRLRTAASNELRWLRLQGVPETVDDDVVSFRGAAQDITERKKREQRLEELIERLEESNERLEQFAYAASHDLQEPLRMVSSYLQLIDRRYSDALDEDGREFLEFAVDGADRMRNMIAGLLQYSRVETQGDEFKPVDLGAVVADVCDDLQMRIEETGAEITAESLPCVDGDEEQLRQVFQNLLDNAIEYSGDEPPQIHITADRNSDEWVIAVSDEGIGIDPDEADRIFEVFQSLHTNDDHQGTGIGLALCQRIVERHDGDIWVESDPGEGSTFSFTLPAVGDHGM